MKQIVVLGSTGSIGTQTLDVIQRMPQQLSLSALAAAGNRPQLLAEQIVRYQPRMVAVYQPEALPAVRQLVEEYSRQSGKAMPAIRWATGMEGVMEAATLPEADMVVTAMVGMIGIQPTAAAIEAGKDIALANKETLVCAGAYIMKLAKEKGVRILPVDSEHGAIFQCLQGVNSEAVHKIIITASGGPFRGYTAQQLQQVTLEQALRHPSWTMGQKITIDSATLMNKGLEMIEARWLFDMRPEQITPVIHPQSVIHSMIELSDGSVLAQLAAPDMRLPIEVALLHPERGPKIAKPLDFGALGALTFEPVDETVFPSTALARFAMERGGLFPAVYNAADEQAVAAFQKGQIAFTDIFAIVERALSAYDRLGSTREEYELEEVLQIQEVVRKSIE